MNKLISVRKATVVLHEWNHVTSNLLSMFCDLVHVLLNRLNRLLRQKNAHRLVKLARVQSIACSVGGVAFTGISLSPGDHPSCKYKMLYLINAPMF